MRLRRFDGEELWRPDLLLMAQFVTESVIYILPSGKISVTRVVIVNNDK